MSVGATVSGLADIAWQGVRLGLQFNPVFAVIGAAIAAALLGYKRASRERRFPAVAALVVTWLAGDGLRVLARGRDSFDGIGAFAHLQPAWGTLLLLALWAVVGFAVGYVVPAWAGITVGRRVTHGTGWLAAIAIAVGVSLGVSSLIASAGALG